jgi:hypothetical protein
LTGNNNVTFHVQEIGINFVYLFAFVASTRRGVEHCTMNPSANRNSNARVLLALIFLASVAAFYFFAASSPSFVFGSRYAYRPGPDADGKVLIILLYSVRPKNPNPSQWMLKIPSGYIKSVIGNMDNVGPSETAYVSMIGKIAPENSGAFAITEDRYGADTIYLDLDNRHIQKSRSKLTGCLSSARNSIELQNADLRVCETKNCRIYDVIDGWSVEYSVPRSLSLDPEPLCNTFRTFLNSHTIKRDNISDKGQ